MWSFDGNAIFYVPVCICIVLYCIIGNLVRKFTFVLFDSNLKCACKNWFKM